MSTENDELSNSDSVRSYIIKAFDEKIDLKIPSNRTNLIKQFKKDNPKINSKSVDTLFSREIPKVGKAYGYEKEELKKKEPVKFDKEKLGTKITRQPSNIKPVGIKNPALNENAKEFQFKELEEKKYKYEIKDTQIQAFVDSIYGLLQLGAKDLDDLTEQESADIGDLWQPIAQDKLGNSQKGQAALAVGGTSGIIIKKVKLAKAKRKARLEKEEKEKLEKKKSPEIANLSNESDDKQ